MKLEARAAAAAGSWCGGGGTVGGPVSVSECNPVWHRSDPCVLQVAAQLCAREPESGQRTGLLLPMRTNLQTPWCTCDWVRSAEGRRSGGRERAVHEQTADGFRALQRSTEHLTLLRIEHRWAVLVTKLPAAAAVPSAAGAQQGSRTIRGTPDLVNSQPIKSALLVATAPLLYASGSC